MTDYYLKDVHSYADSATGRLNAQEKAAKLEFAVTRHVGLHHRVYELSLEPAPDWDVFEKRLFELTPLEREALESKRLFGAEVIVGVDPASPDGDRDAVVVGVRRDGRVEITDMVTLNPGQHVVGVNEDGMLTISAASMGQINAGMMKFSHQDGSTSEIDFGEGEIRFHDTPGHKKLNEVVASKVARVKITGHDFIEVIESMRRQIKMPDYDRPSIVHFASDPHDHDLLNALDRAEEAIMWAVKYITAGE